MKMKLLVCFMTVAMAVSLVACGEKPGDVQIDEEIVTEESSTSTEAVEESTEEVVEAEAPAENPPLDPAADVFVGTWMVDRSIVVVRKSENNSMLVTVTNSPDSQTAIAWNYECLYENGDLVSLPTGSKSTTTTTDDPSAPNVELNYSDGSASFHIENNILTWTDEKEDAGKDLEFAQMNQ